MAADFSLLSQPNFAAAALSGYQAGSALGKQKQLDQAMSNIDLSKPETLLPVLRADPSTGAALIGASVKIHAEDRAQQAQAAQAAALGDYFKGQSGGSGASSPAPTPIAASATPANPIATASGTGPDSSGGDIVVNAPHPLTQMPPTLQQTVGKLIGAGVPLEDATHFVSLVGTMTKQQTDALNDQQEAIGSIASAIPKNLSLADRGQWVAQHKDYLLSHNVQESKIDAFIANPSDENITSAQNLAMGTKDAINAARQAAAEAETVKQHGIENSLSQQRVGLEGASVAIARGHLALDQKTAAQKAVGGGSGAGGGIPSPTRSVGGKTYYQVNGKWYDNAAGK